MGYKAGHVKRNNKTGEVAVRTVFDVEQFPNMEFIVATKDVGARNAPGSEVKGWDDLFVPDA